MRAELEVKKAYDAGYDAAINGANMTNCDFRIFSTQEKTRAWEKGNADALRRIKGKDGE